jgi:hypothetical protein
MVINKLENIENGIIELLLKKYKVDKYNENINTYKNNAIDLETLKQNYISEDIIIFDNIINKYLEIDSKLCSYDIDILNLLIKYINLYKKYKNEFIIPQKYTIIESVYYYLGYHKPTPKYITIEYFEQKSKTINSKIKDIYLKLFSTIIN